jgi:RNA-directed DNA polymerase
MSEIPVHSRPRRLAEWINPTGARKVHSLVDKVYQRKNLEMAWEKVKANRGSGGVDGQNLKEFAAQLDQQLDRLQSELKGDAYQPQPVRQVQIPKAGKPDEFRKLGIPTIYDRVCQQALLNRLEPIFEPVFDDANFGYRRGRSTKDAMRKVWREIHSGREWIVDADLKNFLETHSQCTPSVFCRSKRPGRASGTWILKPFRRPSRTWTALSSPRFTR